MNISKTLNFICKVCEMVKNQKRNQEKRLTECPFVEGEYFYKVHVDTTLIDVTCNKRVKGECVVTKKPCYLNDEIKELPKETPLSYAINIIILILAFIGLVSLIKHFF